MHTYFVNTEVKRITTYFKISEKAEQVFLVEFVNFGVDRQFMRTAFEESRGSISDFTAVGGDYGIKITDLKFS